MFLATIRFRHHLDGTGDWIDVAHREVGVDVIRAAQTKFGRRRTLYS